jgi:hypothetical protein
VVEYIVVEVAFVVVEFCAVKFCNVVEPVASRLVVDTLPKYPVPLTVSAVVDAYGNVDAVDDVAVKYEAVMLFPAQISDEAYMDEEANRLFCIHSAVDVELVF